MQDVVGLRDSNLNYKYNISIIVMKSKFFVFICKMSVVKHFCRKIISYRIVWLNESLTHDYLIKKGFVLKDGYYIEPNVKSKYAIRITFHDNGSHYKVSVGESDKVIAVESSVEWFELFYLLHHPDNGRFYLADI